MIRREGPPRAAQPTATKEEETKVRMHTEVLEEGVWALVLLLVQRQRQSKELLVDHCSDLINIYLSIDIDMIFIF